ncbi:MAG: right-handed parallel beta-helix repeat-containing protein [Microthrixaceae bacterium]
MIGLGGHVGRQASQWKRPKRSVAKVVVALGALASACGGTDAPNAGPRVLRVGQDYESIQDAVDDAEPDDLVLIGPGTYREAVTVATPRLTIRGTDRNAVVLDGAGELIDGFRVTADRVVIENLTVRNYLINGVIFSAEEPGAYKAEDAQSGPVGWRASYVTASNNGLYGLYALGTGPGQFDHNYASGSPDSGIYVGQCRDCGAIVRDNVAEANAIGYENTNASGVIVAGNVFQKNRVGITINSADTEQLAPQAGGTIVANRIVDNDNPDTPETQGGFGVGVAVAGGRDNSIERNVVTGHPGAGVVLVDQDGYEPTGNSVVDNSMSGNALDLLLASTVGAAGPNTSNCFDNGATSTRPDGLEDALPCDKAAGRVVPVPFDLPAAPAGIDYADVALPPRQPQMPGEVDSWTAPAARPSPPDLSTITVPAT